jgi:microcystin-dependent protein
VHEPVVEAVEERGEEGEESTIGDMPASEGALVGKQVLGVQVAAAAAAVLVVRTEGEEGVQAGDAHSTDSVAGAVGAVGVGVHVDGTAPGTESRSAQARCAAGGLQRRV